MPHPLEQLREDALRDIGDARDERGLDAVRVRYLGRSGSISAWGEQMKTLGKEERPIVGKLLNEARKTFAAKKKMRRSPASTSHCQGRQARKGRCIRSPKYSTARSRFSVEWV